MSSPAVEAVLFDLDDTLIDWWGSLRRALSAVVDDSDTDLLVEHVRRTCWETHPEHDFVWHRNTWMLWEHRNDIWDEVLGHRHPDERRLTLKRFEEELWVGFFPDVVPALDRLVDRTRLAVLSNNVHIGREASRLRLHDWFEFAMHPTLGFKPEPVAFTEACDRLGIEPHRVAYVGDSVRADALGAAAAGLVPVWLDRWNDDWSTRPAEVRRVASLDELPAALGFS